jgi:flavin reductase (DIM6/NTAB) family NADH-FMN oxidoreductase RutF
MKRALKALLKPLLMGVASIPQFVPGDVLARAEEIRIALEGCGSSQDVTANCVVASLRPLLFAIAFPDGMNTSDLIRARLRLTISEQTPPYRELGRIRLRFTDVIHLPDMQLGLFASSGQENYCVSQPRRRLYDLYQQWQARRNRDPYNFRMEPSDLRSLALFYIHARPVVLVTVACGERSNIFPMDLIGPITGPYFLMALRSTSPAVDLMKRSRRIALSSMSLDYKQTIYDLGKHHRLECIEWESLPFKSVPSPTFGLPIPEDAHSVVEREIVAAHTVGSHVLFVTTCVRLTHFTDGGQMGHIVGFYDDYLQRKRRIKPAR